MTSQMISIKDACILLNNEKSYSTLSRLAKSLRESKTNKKHTKTIEGKHYISVDYLKEKYGHLISNDNQSEQHDKSNDKHDNQSEQHDQLDDKQNTSNLDLTSVLELFKEQLTEKDIQISELNQRLKESHYTNQMLTNKIALLEENPKGQDFNRWQRFLYKCGLIQKR